MKDVDIFWPSEIPVPKIGSKFMISNHIFGNPYTVTNYSVFIDDSKAYLQIKCINRRGEFVLLQANSLKNIVWLTNNQL